MIYEHKTHPPIPQRRFVQRVLLHITFVFVLLVISLLIGMAGYAHFEGLPWRDAFLNSAMLMGGMGPVDAPKTDGGKLFAGFYALYAGLVLLIAVALLLTPLLHRMMHKFHWERDQ